MVEKNYYRLAAHATGIEMKDSFPFENATWHPEKVRLDQNYPNPFNPVTIIRFEIPEESQVNLKIYSRTGKLVAILKDEVLSAGKYQVPWDASLMPGGQYYYKLQVNRQTFTKSMTLVN